MFWGTHASRGGHRAAGAGGIQRVNRDALLVDDDFEVAETQSGDGAAVGVQHHGIHQDETDVDGLFQIYALRLFTSVTVALGDHAWRCGRQQR